MGEGDKELADFNRNVGKVIDTLRRDYAHMFTSNDDLDFDIYTEDLQLVDPVRGQAWGGWRGGGGGMTRLDPREVVCTVQVWMFCRKAACTAESVCVLHMFAKQRPSSPRPPHISPILSSLQISRHFL